MLGKNSGDNKLLQRNFYAMNGWIFFYKNNFPCVYLYIYRIYIYKVWHMLLFLDHTIIFIILFSKKGNLF